MCWPKHVILGDETHIDGEVESIIVFPSTAIARAPHFAVCLQYSSQERSTLLWLHFHGCHHALKLKCQNSPWWQRCGCCNNFLLSFWPPLLTNTLNSNSMGLTCQTAWSSPTLASFPGHVVDTIYTCVNYPMRSWGIVYHFIMISIHRRIIIHCTSTIKDGSLLQGYHWVLAHLAYVASLLDSSPAFFCLLYKKRGVSLEDLIMCAMTY